MFVGEVLLSQNQVVTLLNKIPSRPIVCEYGGGFSQLSEEGVFFVGTDKDGSQLPPRWICSPLLVANTRDAKSGEWGRLLHPMEHSAWKR